MLSLIYNWRFFYLTNFLAFIVKNEGYYLTIDRIPIFVEGECVGFCMSAISGNCFLAHRNTPYAINGSPEHIVMGILRNVWIIQSVIFLPGL